MSDIRYEVMRALIKLENNNAYSNIIFNTIANYKKFDARDVSFASRLFYGVLEKKLTLEYIIAKYSKYPLKKLSVEILMILKMAMYQFLYMDKIPQHSVVDTSVTLAKKCKKMSATGFINAILRAFLRDGCKYKLPPKEKDYEKYLEIKYSYPKEIIKLWSDSYGKKITLNLLENSKKDKQITIRANTLKTDSEKLLDILQKDGIKARISNILPDAIHIESGMNNINENKAFKEGLFHVQNLSSQICCDILSAKKGESVADLCCAPGGKSFTIAQYMNNTGSISARDIYANKLNLVKNGARRLCIKIIQAQCKDASKQYEGERLKFDRILCDAPCSGLGLFNSKPEIKYSTTPEKLDNLADLQYIFLSMSVHMLKVNGILVYSTCTLNINENNRNVKKLLLQYPELEAVPIDKSKYKLADYGFKEASNELTIFPDNALDGFFVAVFRKRGI